MLVYQLILDLQRIHLFDNLRQLTHTRYAVKVHNTNHLCQYTREMQINHQKIATKYTVGHIRIFKYSSQTFDHHHTLGNFIRALRQSIDLVYCRSGKFNPGLLQLKIRRTPSIQQWIHGTQPRTDIKSSQRRFRMPECNREIGAILRFCLQVEDSRFIQKLLYSIRRGHIVFRRGFNRFQYQVRYDTEIFTRHSFNSCFPFYANRLFLNIIPTCPVVLFPLNHCNRPEYISCLCFRRA